MTELCDIAFKYGTDRCPQIGHSYTPYYYNLLKDKRQTIKKVLELGIGSSKTMQWTPDHYQVGAGLRMWRDFFPNAHIWGIDIDPSAYFEDERITTIIADTRRRDVMRALINKIGTDMDLVIDDGTHKSAAQIRVASTFMPLLKKDVIYIIEDSKSANTVKSALTDYDCEIIKFSKHKQNNLIIVRNK